MNEVQNKIIELEEQANKLVENLTLLHEQAVSYKNASDKLESANESLENMIQETKNLTIESHEIIKSIRAIGTSKILDKIDDSINQQAVYDKKNKFIMYGIVGGLVLVIILQIIQLFI